MEPAKFAKTETMENPRIAIVGGGLCGLALAISLSRQGSDVKIYEKSDQLRSNSQGALIMFPNGLKALAAIDPELPAELREAGTSFTSFNFINRKAAEAGEDQVLDLSAGMLNYESKFGEGVTLVAWTDIQRVLAARVPESCVECGKRLETLDDVGDMVTLHFSDGTSAEADVVIAADGTFSATRCMLQKAGKLPHEPTVRFFGQSNWASILQDYSNPPFGVGSAAGASRMLNFAAERPLHATFMNLGHGRTFWQLRATDETGELRSVTAKEAGIMGAPDLKMRLQTLASDIPELLAAIDATPESQIYERSMYDLHPPLERFVSGRVVLVGDAAHAAHPSPGQGANFAFEDAAVLASLLGRPARRSDVLQRLEAYEESRLARCHTLQGWAADAGSGQKQGASISPEEKANQERFYCSWSASPLGAIQPSSPDA